MFCVFFHVNETWGSWIRLAACPPAVVRQYASMCFGGVALKGECEIFWAGHFQNLDSSCCFVQQGATQQAANITLMLKSPHTYHDFNKVAHEHIQKNNINTHLWSPDDDKSHVHPPFSSVLVSTNS